MSDETDPFPDPRGLGRALRPDLRRSLPGIQRDPDTEALRGGLRGPVAGLVDRVPRGHLESPRCPRRRDLCRMSRPEVRDRPGHPAARRRLAADRVIEERADAVRRQICQRPRHRHGQRALSLRQRGTWRHTYLRHDIPTLRIRLIRREHPYILHFRDILRTESMCAIRDNILQTVIYLNVRLLIIMVMIIDFVISTINYA